VHVVDLDAEMPRATPALSPEKLDGHARRWRAFAAVGRPLMVLV